jgi:diamine N-acetyltransferase
LAYYFNEPVGYFKLKLDSYFEESERKQIQLQKIYVLKDYLNKKVGGALLQHIFELQELRDYQVIWLNVLYTNDRAIYFMKNIGLENSERAITK